MSHTGKSAPTTAQMHTQKLCFEDLSIHYISYADRITELLFTSMERVHFDSRPAKDIGGMTNKNGEVGA